MKETEWERKRGRQFVMRGRAIAGLARTPRRSLIVLKLEKTCQLFVTYIYTYIQGATHKPHTYLFCFVMSFSWLNAFKCSADSKWKPGKGKAKNQNRKPKTKNTKGSPSHSTQATQKRQRSRSWRRRRSRKLHAHAHTQINITSGTKSQEPKNRRAEVWQHCSRRDSTKRFRRVFSV